MLRIVGTRPIVGLSRSLIPKIPSKLLWNACNISKIHSSVVPHRSFSTTMTSQMRHKPPKSRIATPSLLNELLDRIPDSVKLALGLTAVGGFVLFVALPFVFVVLPPIMVGSFLWYKITRSRSQKQMNERWSNVLDSTLEFRPRHRRDPMVLPPLEQINSELANFELRRLMDAFLLNEDGIADFFKIGDVNDLALGTIEAIQYDWHTTTKNVDGFIQEVDELMTVQSRDLYDKSSGERIARVVVSLANVDKPVFETIIEQNFGINKSRCVIEVIPFGFIASKKFVIKTKSTDEDGSDEIIDVKGRTRTL